MRGEVIIFRPFITDERKRENAQFANEKERFGELAEEISEKRHAPLFYSQRGSSLGAPNCSAYFIAERK